MGDRRATRPRGDRRHGPGRAATVAVALVLVSAGLACTDDDPGVSEGSALDVWVRPGDGTGGDGTRSSPFTGLRAARDAVRDRIATADGDVTVHLQGGTYELDETLRLGPEDSGRDGHRVVWSAEGDDPVVISGGRRITGWSPSPDDSALWSAPAPEDLETRQLYVDGVRAQVAQGPPPVTLTPTDTGYEASDTTMAGWANPADVEFVYPAGPSNWTETRCRVASIDGTDITMVQPCFDNSSRRDTPGTVLNVSGFGQQLPPPTTVANARELLTEPGQWYHDRASGTLLYRPLPGQSPDEVEVVAPRLDTLIEGTGTTEEAVADITFRGLTFSYAGWNEPSGPDGYSPVQAGARLTGERAYERQGACDGAGSTCPYMAFPLTPGNVTFTYSRGIRFLDATFEHLGAAGLRFGNGTQDALVTGGLFRDISGSGLVVGDIDRPEAEGADRVSGVEVSNNYLTDVGAEYQDAPAIVVGYAEDTSLVHNQIDDVPYSGISIGWGGWAERLHGRDPLANYSRRNRIAHNLVFDHMTTTVDGGGIYTNGIQGSSMDDAEVIEDNVVLQQHHLSWGIYTDNGTMHVKVRNNAVYDVMFVPLAAAAIPGLSPYFSFGGCGGGPIEFDGNYSVQDDPAAGLISASPDCGGHPLEGVEVVSNHVIGAQDQIPDELLANAGLEPEYRDRLRPKPMPTGLPPFTQAP